MRLVFADTGYWEAVLNPKDGLHERAKDVSRALGQVRQLTSEMVLDELLAALSGLSVRSFAIRGVEAIRANPNVEVVLRHRFSSAMPSNITSAWQTRNGV
jgi:predicted nucleic acid-binding protein